MDTRGDGLTEAQRREHVAYMAKLKEFERRAVSARADIELETVREIRLWWLGIFIAVMLVAMLFGGKDAPTWGDLIETLTMLAAASAAFHVVTWGLLRGYIWWRYERDE